MQAVHLGNKVLQVPIIQGGMGVGVSLDKLAGAVAAYGGMGVISSAFAGFQAPDFDKDPKNVTLREIPKIIARAKEKAKNCGLIGINIMVALDDYSDHVRAAVRGQVDAIISGAGLPLNLPGLVEDTSILLAPIVSSGRVAKLICKSWQRHHNRLPDFIVVEGAKAGGHLGFLFDDLAENKAQSNEAILTDVLAAIAPFEEDLGRRIPVFLAGGIFDYNDIQQALQLGASGVQIGTRFIVTEECDADQGFKDVILQADEADIVLTKSPVGMPGRAVATSLVKKVAEGKDQKPERCYKCLGPCDVRTTPYCISEALLASARGDVEQGLFFCGANGARLKEMTTVPKLMAELQGKGNE